MIDFRDGTLRVIVLDLICINDKGNPLINTGLREGMEVRRKRYSQRKIPIGLPQELG
jgi:hypothetical protein